MIGHDLDLNIEFIYKSIHKNVKLNCCFESKPLDVHHTDSTLDYLNHLLLSSPRIEA